MAKHSGSSMGSMGWEDAWEQLCGHLPYAVGKTRSLEGPFDDRPVNL